MDQTRPTLTIKSWSYAKKVETRERGTGPGAVEVHSVQTRETVRAVFEIVGVPDFPRKKTAWSPNPRPAQIVRPKTMVLDFYADEGGAWKRGYGEKMQAVNINKGGAEGATVEVTTWDWPEGLETTLLGADGDGRSDALDWVRAEYPR